MSPYFVLRYFNAFFMEKEEVVAHGHFLLIVENSKERILKLRRIIFTLFSFIHRQILDSGTQFPLPKPIPEVVVENALNGRYKVLFYCIKHRQDVKIQ